MNANPEPGELRVEGGAATYSLRVPEDYPHCAGHFPGDPLVPGVTQLAWAARAVEALIGSPLPPHRIGRFKFRAPIRPGAEVVATARRAGQRFEIEIRSDGAFAAGGSLTLQPTP